MITLDKININTIRTLDAWLKFGTVFLVYRLCTYFFFDYDNPNAVLFDPESIKLVIFLLLGFTIYYLFIKPLLPSNFGHPVIQNLSNDILMFGTVLISSHTLDVIFNGVKFFDKQWMKTAGIILLSFSIYDILINPFIPFDKINPSTQPLVNDWVKFGSFLVIFRLLQGKSVFDPKWILVILFTLLGFTGYNFITKR